MQGKYDTNPIHELYKILEWQLTEWNYDPIDKMDTMLKLILLNPPFPIPPWKYCLLSVSLSL